jgi:glycosyltransferase involved in cell wall biosynthesis
VEPYDAPTIAVIVIAWNEADALRRVLPAIPRELATEVLVVDGGSTDGTPAVAREHGARVVTQRGRGYGDACLSGALATDAVVLVFLDGDYADDPLELPRVLAPLLDGRADLVVGTRDGHGTESGALPAHQRAGNRACALLARALYGVKLRDFGSMRAIRRATLLALDMREMTYGWPVEMVVNAARRGYRVEGVPVRYRRRIGASKVGGTLTGSVRAATCMLAVILAGRFRRDHDRRACVRAGIDRKGQV